MSADSTERILLSTRRRVEPAREAEYRRAWERVAAAVASPGGHAWLFRSAERQNVFLEFIEYAGTAELLGDERVRAARGALGREFGEGREERWTGIG